MEKSLQKRVNNSIFNLKYVFKEERQRHFTFAFKKNRLVSVGINYKNSTHPLAKKFNYFDDKIHAELDCLSKLGDFYIPHLTFVNVRVNRRGEIMMAKPCDNCQVLLRAFGVNSIYYYDNGYRLLNL